MSQYNSVFSNQVNQTPSLTGEETIRVDQIDFDTTCPCQITACDGGTIKVCAKMEIEDLVIDSLCIDGELGCDELVVETGATNGVCFADNPCATKPIVVRRALYEDASPTGSTVLQSNDSARNLLLSATYGSNQIITQSSSTTTITSNSGDVNILAPTATAKISTFTPLVKCDDSDLWDGGYNTGSEITPIELIIRRTTEGNTDGGITMAVGAGGPTQDTYWKIPTNGIKIAPLHVEQRQTIHGTVFPPTDDILPSTVHAGFQAIATLLSGFGRSQVFDILFQPYYEISGETTGFIPDPAFGGGIRYHIGAATNKITYLWTSYINGAPTSDYVLRSELTALEARLTALEALHP